MRIKLYLNALVLVIFISPSAAFSDVEKLLSSEFLYSSPLGSYLEAGILLDNTDHGRRPLDSIPGWVESSSNLPMGFGYKFRTGERALALKSVTFMIATYNNEPSFQGNIQVDIYRAIDDGALEKSPIASWEISGVRFLPNGKYIELPLHGFMLDPNRTFAVTITAPNAKKAIILGYQVPNIPPTPSEGIKALHPVIRNIEGNCIEFFGNPYIWLQGWDLSDAKTKLVNYKTIINSVAVLLLLSIITLSIIWRWHSTRQK